MADKEKSRRRRNKCTEKKGLNSKTMKKQRKDIHILRFNRQGKRYKKMNNFRYRLFWWKCYGLDGIRMIENARKEEDDELWNMIESGAEGGSEFIEKRKYRANMKGGDD